MGRVAGDTVGEVVGLVVGLVAHFEVELSLAWYTRLWEGMEDDGGLRAFSVRWGWLGILRHRSQRLSGWSWRSSASKGRNRRQAPPHSLPYLCDGASDHRRATYHLIYRAVSCILVQLPAQQRVEPPRWAQAASLSTYSDHSAILKVFPNHPSVDCSPLGAHRLLQFPTPPPPRRSSHRLQWRVPRPTWERPAHWRRT